jgi:hypothetical protein
VTSDPKDVEIMFTPDLELEKMIKDESLAVSADLKKNGIQWTVRDDLRGDMHDDVMFRVEKAMKLHELSRTYRRARMEMFLFKNN